MSIRSADWLAFTGLTVTIVALFWLFYLWRPGTMPS